MSTLTHAAPPESQIPADSGTPKRRRRWPFILIACVTSLIVTSGGIAFWWVATRYAPMRPNQSYAHVRVEGGQITRVESIEPSGQPFVAFHVPYRDGKWLDSGFTLRNDGPLPITVDQIGFPGSSDPPVRQISASMNALGVEWGPGPPDQMIPFRPFPLGTHEARYIFVRYQFFGCSMSGSPEEYVTWAWQTVKFRIRIGWITIHRSDKLPMRYSIAVSGREGCSG